MFNLFENILSASSAGKALGNTGAFSGMQNPISPVTQAFGESNVVKKTAPIVQQAKQDFSTMTQPIIKSVNKGIVQPIKKEYDYTKKVGQTKSKYATELMSLGLTAQAMDEMGLSDEEKQAVKAIYDQVGAKIPGLEEAEQAKAVIESKKNVSGVDNVFGNVVGGITAEIPKVVGETAGFLSKVGQNTPMALAGTAIKAGFSDKTFGQLREEQKAESNKLSELGQKGKEFYQKYGAYNPESTSAKVGETITDIGATLVGPNKVGVISKLGKLATPARIAMEGGLAGAKYGVATEGRIDPTDVAVGAGGNLAVAGAFRGGQKVAQMLTPKTAEQKALESIGGKTVKGIVQGKKVNIQEPTEGIITKISTPLRTKDPKVLTGRALTPSYAGKSDKQKMSALGKMTENVKEFYSQIRTGKMKGDISTIEDSANTVINNLDSIGANIGEAVKGAKGNVGPSVGTMDEITNTLSNKIEARSGAFKPLQNFLDDIKEGLTLQDAFKAKRVYQAEIGKLIRSGDAGTDSYQALVKGVQELSDNIDNVVEKSIGSKQFIEWKRQYKLLKSIVKDMSNSAVVEGRRSPQTFVEQLGTLQAISDGITNPLSTARTILAKEIGELNTRGGAWKELIKNYDKQAIEMAKKVTPKPIKVGQQ